MRSNLESNFTTLMSVRIAACVPSTCSRQVLQAAMSEALDTVNAKLAATGLRLQSRLPETATAVAGPWRAAGTADYIVM